MSGKRSIDDGSAASSPTSFAIGDGDQEGFGPGIGKRKRGKDTERSADVVAPAAADPRRKPAGDGEGDEPQMARGEGDGEGDKRKRRRGGGEDVDAVDGADVGDDGRGPGLKLLLRRDGGGWSSKREGAEEDKGREGASAEERDEVAKRQKVSPVPSPLGPRKDSERERFMVPLGPDGKPLEVIPGKGEVLAKEPEVIRQRVGKAHESVDAAVAIDRAVAAGDVVEKGNNPRIENISQGQLIPPLGGEGEHGATAAKGVGVPAPPPTSAFRAEVHRIPAHAGWFHWKLVHSIERHALPEFFSGRSPSKTPEIYKQYRDFIINRYRENPQRVLTFTEVRRMLVGDVNALRRVFEFLDHWGLINYQASADSRKQPAMWAGAPALLVESSNGSLQLTTPSVSLAATVYQSKPSRAPAAKGGTSPGAEEASKALSTRKNVLADAASDAAVKSALLGSAPRTVGFHCDACGADCSQHRYHCQKQADFDLCPACFADGKYGAGVMTSDFVRMDAVAGPQDIGTEDWTDQETLLLLEALEIYGDNWAEIAEHVATKSKAQCMLHFVRLPIEDPFLETMEKRTLSIEAPPAPATDPTTAADGNASTPGAKAPSAETPKGGASNDSKKPPPPLTDTVTAFADAGNPVMAQVAFLASMVGPHVAAVAAQAALKALSEESPMASHAIKEGLTLQASLIKPNNATGAAAEGEQARADTAGGEAREDNNKAEAMPGGEPADGKEGREGEENCQQVASASDAAAKEKLKEGGEDASPTKTQQPLSSVQVRAAAATALAAAAVKAKLLADKEEEEIQRLVCTVIELQLKKLEIKLRHFDELEDMLERERGGIERARQQLYNDRLRLSAARNVVPPRRAPAATSAQIRPPAPVASRPPPNPSGTVGFATGGAPTHAPVGAVEGSLAASRPAVGSDANKEVGAANASVPKPEQASGGSQQGTVAASGFGAGNAASGQRGAAGEAVVGGGHG